MKKEACNLDIYITTYNRCDFLKESITSILEQTFGNFELFILDNCSTDDTEIVVKQFHDERLRYIKHDRNLGGIGNICYAFKKSKKKYFVIFHDDDLMCPDLIKTEIEILENNPSLAMVSCKVDVVNETITYEDYMKNVYRRFGTENIRFKEYYNDLLLHDYIYNRKAIMFPTIMYRTDFFRTNDIYIQTLAGPSADILLSMDVERKGGHLAEIESKMIGYRYHKGQDSQIARCEMVCNLFDFMYSKEYYKKWLNSNTHGRERYYKKVLFNELCLYADSKIDFKELREDLCKYEKAIKISGRIVFIRKVAMFMCEYCDPLVKKTYIIAKKIRKLQSVREN